MKLFQDVQEEYGQQRGFFLVNLSLSVVAGCFAVLILLHAIPLRNQLLPPYMDWLIFGMLVSLSAMNLLSALRMKLSGKREYIYITLLSGVFGSVVAVLIVAL